MKTPLTSFSHHPIISSRTFLEDYVFFVALQVPSPKSNREEKGKNIAKYLHKNTLWQEWTRNEEIPSKDCFLFRPQKLWHWNKFINYGFAICLPGCASRLLPERNLFLETEILLPPVPSQQDFGKTFFCLFRGGKLFSVLWNSLSGFGTRQQVLHEFLMMDVHYMQAFPVSWSRQTPPWVDELAEHINSRHPVCWLEALLITSAKSTSRAIQNSRHAEARRERSTRLPPKFLRHWSRS